MALSIIRSTLNRMRANDQMAIQDLQHTNQVLAQLDRNKLEFIEVAAHELRTPLTVMKGYLNLLKLDEYWYDAKLNIVSGTQGAYKKAPIQPGEIVEITLRSPDKPGIQRNQVMFTHAYGKVDAKTVKAFK